MKQQLQTHFKQQLKFWALILGILCTSLISSQQVQGQTLLAGWDFQTTTNGGTAAAAAPSTPTTFVANFGTGSLYLNGTNGSSTWITATSGNQLTSFGGSALNAGAGFSTVTSGASSLSVLSNVANGKSMVFSVNMTSYSNLVISYVTQRTASGFTTQTWEYSTNGTTWNPIQAVSVPTGYTTQTLSTVTGLNNSATALVRLTVTGATTTTGNNRIDNVQFNVSTLAAPVVTSNSSTATVGSNFSYFISATNTPTSYTSSALPNGLTLNGSTGEISGIPTTAQSATTYTIDATNGVGTGSGTVDITINQGTQTINFGSLSPVTVGVSPFNLTATGGGSGNPITYTSSNPAVADVVGNVLTVYSAGNTDITANQAGNSNYLAASPVVQNLIVNPATLTPQTITFGPLGTVVYDAATITLTATGGGSGNPVTYVSSNTNVATIAGNILTLKGPGTADITASQAGNGAYYAAPDVMQTITVTPKDLTISGVVVTPKNYDGTNTATLDLTAATLNTLVGTDVVTITGTATYDNVNAGSGINMTMSLSLAGADAAKYTLNTQPTVTGDINQAPQFINFASLSPVTIGDPSFNLTATGG
ncbi:MAG: putative Ig domain-containing protein, partial [Chitinophagaceae bacterium]|nr:putative Ig domain-containing protein [Chitinophagaceae bacterium]